MNTGTILAARNASELAGVIAHEIGHVAYRHVANNYNRQRNTGILYQTGVVAAWLFGGGMGASAAQLGGGLAATAYLNQFGREAEMQADAFAVDAMPRANWDPNGLVTLLPDAAGAGRAERADLPLEPPGHRGAHRRRPATRIAELSPGGSLRVDDGGKLAIIQRRIEILTGAQPAPSPSRSTSERHAMRTSPPAARTLAELRASGWSPRSVREELRANLLARLRAGESLCEGVLGYEDSVLPALENALLCGHDLIFLGERGQAKTRMIRSLVGLLDEWIPEIAGSEIHDDPFAPVSARGRALLARARRALRDRLGAPRRPLRREARHARRLDRRPDRRRRSREGRARAARWPTSSPSTSGSCRAPIAGSSASTSCPT